MSKPAELVDEGYRYRESYYEIEKMYVTIGDKSVTISVSHPDIKPRTLVGLCLVENLATLALEEGVDREIVASVIWECSRSTGDLADRLSRLLTIDTGTKTK